jgi:4-amino-4-deoxy-L-arabinose transferase-like glycosyltransferase
MPTLLTHVHTPATPADRDGDRRPLSGWLLPVLGVGSLLASCILWSLRKPMWGDEVFTWTELHDPSLRHLLGAISRLGGGGMPLFSLTAWPWAHGFGFSDLSLRLYSSVAVCGSFLVLFAALRRRLGVLAAFLATSFGFCASLIVLDQNAEARGYGLYLLLAALATAQVLKVAETESWRPRDLFFLAVTQAGLVLGHPLGLLYAGLLLLALMAVDLSAQQLRFRVYLACVAGWLALIPWIPALRASAAVGRPHGWIGVPSVGDLASSLSFWLFTGLYWQIPHLPSMVLVAGWLAGVACVTLIVFAPSIGLRDGSRANRAVFFTGCALLLGPALFFIVSHLTTPIFLPRYLLPSVAGVCLLGAAAADRIRFGKRSSVALGAVFLALPVATALLAHPTGLDVTRVDEIAGGRIVVCAGLKDFLVMTRYTAQPESPRFPLDAEVADTLPGADADFRLMVNYRREGYFAGHLADTQTLLGEPSFLFLGDSGAAWFRMRIAGDPHFTWKNLARIDSSRSLIEVDRRP